MSEDPETGRRGESEAERASQLLQRLAEQIAERERRNHGHRAQPGRRHDMSETERPSERQQLLMALLEEALAHPGIARVLADGGHNAVTLREAGSAGRWSEGIAPAIEDIRSRPLGQEEPRPGDNRVLAADQAETPAAARQVEALGEPTDAPARGAEEKGLFSRLRRLTDRRGETEGSAGPIAAGDPADDLPDALRKRYAVHVADDRKTIQLFERDQKEPAITLDARSISTPHNGGVVVADVIALARDRGWQALKVSGTAEFKDAVWLEANKLGLSVEHDASPAVRASFAKWDRERPDNQVQEASPPHGDGARQKMDRSLADAFVTKSPEERLADPRLRNAQLELMVGIRTAEKELHRPIAELPDVARALTATIRDQLAQGRVFEAPFVKAAPPRHSAKPVQNPRIDADRIPPPRP